MREQSFAGFWEDEEGTRVHISGGKLRGPDGTLELEDRGGGWLSVRAGSQVFDATCSGDGRLVWSDDSVWVRYSPQLRRPAASGPAQPCSGLCSEPPMAEERGGPLELPAPRGNMPDQFATGDYPIWAVVGGEASGGIIVKMESSLSSAKLAYRLTTGARVEELEMEGDRLHYRRLKGDGPDFGWVSVRCNDKVLVVPVNEEPELMRSNAETWDPTSLYAQSFKRCRPIGGSRDMRRTEELDASDAADSSSSGYVPAFMSVATLTESHALAGAVSELSLAEFGFDLVKGLDLARKEGALEGSVLASGSGVVGFVLFGQLEKKTDMYVHYLAVDSRQRRQGYGRCLLEHVRRRCLEMKVEHMSAECRFHNVEYYLGLGFSLNGVDEGATASGRAMQMQHLRYNTARKFRSVRRSN